MNLFKKKLKKYIYMYTCIIDGWIDTDTDTDIDIEIGVDIDIDA